MLGASGFSLMASYTSFSLSDILVDGCVFLPPVMDLTAPILYHILECGFESTNLEAARMAASSSLSLVFFLTSLMKLTSASLSSSPLRKYVLLFSIPSAGWKLPSSICPCFAASADGSSFWQKRYLLTQPLSAQYAISTRVGKKMKVSTASHRSTTSGELTLSMMMSQR